MADSEKQSSAENNLSDETKMQKDAPENDSFSLRSLGGDLLDILEAVFVSFFVIILLFGYLLRPVTVDGHSMNDTLFNGDRLVMWSLGYHPQNGDIVIIDDEEAGYFTDSEQTQVARREGMKKRLVKRVIAVGGQTLDIDFDNGDVTLDGKLLNEPYIKDLTHRDENAFSHYPITIPKGYVFVMGDNRQGSSDSRCPSVALVPEEQVIGKALWRFYRQEDLCSSWTDRFAVLF